MPPNPAAIYASPHTMGEKSAAIPSSMKESPISGRILSENVPAPNSDFALTLAEIQDLRDNADLTIFGNLVIPDDPWPSPLTGVIYITGNFEINTPATYSGDAVLVVDGNQICGIITERDYLRRVALPQRSPQRTPVEEVMTRKVHMVRPHHTVREAMALMTDCRCRHLPVSDRSRLLGLVSIGDCVAHLCRETSIENDYLNEYISGCYPG